MTPKVRWLCPLECATREKSSLGLGFAFLAAVPCRVYSHLSMDPTPLLLGVPLLLLTDQRGKSASMSHYTHVQLAILSVICGATVQSLVRDAQVDQSRSPPTSVINPPTESLGLIPSAAHICGMKIDFIRHDRCRYCSSIE